MLSSKFVGDIQKQRLSECSAKFVENGYVILDDFFPEGVAEKLRSEIDELQKASLMKPNRVQFLVEGKNIVVTKPGIFEADLFDNNLRSFEPLECFRLVYGEWGEQLVNALETAGISEDQSLVCGEQGRVVKLQYNNGSGGCFPLHYDNPGRPNKRAITCAVYLNPEWKDGDGGELELLPFLSEAVKVSPKMNRLVIFKSDAMLHRVLPSKAERFCFTIWIDGKLVNSDEDTQLRLKRSDAEDMNLLSSALRASPVQRLLARATYREKFEVSLRDCMGSSPGLKILLAQHVAHLQAVKRNQGLSDLIESLRLYADQNTADSEND